jgi:hypothetical protein
MLELGTYNEMFILQCPVKSTLGLEAIQPGILNLLKSKIFNQFLHLHVLNQKSSFRHMLEFDEHNTYKPLKVPNHVLCCGIQLFFGKVLQMKYYKGAYNFFHFMYLLL